MFKKSSSKLGLALALSAAAGLAHAKAGIEITFTAPEDKDVASYDVMCKIGASDMEKVGTIQNQAGVPPVGRYPDLLIEDGRVIQCGVIAVDAAGNKGPMSKLSNKVSVDKVAPGVVNNVVIRIITVAQ